MRVRAGMVAAVLALVAAVGCASNVGPATAPPTVDVTGKWMGPWVALSQQLGSGTAEMTLKQTGSKFTGQLLVIGTATDPSGYMEGVVSGNEVRILLPENFSGSLTVQGDTMKGIVHGIVEANITLVRQK